MLTSSKEDVTDSKVKQLSTSIILHLYSVDYKLLDSSVSKLSLNRKTPLRKIIIEHETSQKQNKGFVNTNEPAVQPLVAAEEQKMRDTGMSFASSTNRQSLFSPGSTTRDRSPGGMGSSQYEGDWSKGIGLRERQRRSTIEPKEIVTSRRM